MIGAAFHPIHTEERWVSIATTEMLEVALPPQELQVLVRRHPHAPPIPDYPSMDARLVLKIRLPKENEQV